MRLVTVFKVLRDFLGFLLTSTGGILVGIDILLLVAHIATRNSEPGAAIAWEPLLLSLGMSGIIMFVGGVLLARNARQG